MQSGLALRNPRSVVVSRLAVAAVLAALVFGALGGYVIRAVTASYTPAAQPPALCAIGTHVVVWYSAHAWECVAD